MTKTADYAATDYQNMKFVYRMSLYNNQVDTALTLYCKETIII